MFIHTQNEIFQNPDSVVDFHWYTGSSNNHIHNYYELLVIMKGEYSHDYLDKIITLGVGDAVLVIPGHHHLISTKQKDTLLANFSISKKAFATITKSVSPEAFAFLTENSGKPFKLSEKHIEHLSFLLNQIYYIGEKNIAVKDYYYISIISWLLSENFLTNGDENTTAQFNIPEWLSVFLKRIQSPNVYCLPLSEIYQLSFYSQSRLLSEFPKHIGVTLIKYITNLKINHAKILLTKTNYSILDISTQLNYSLSYFIALFKKNTGYTPNEYRKKFYITPPQKK